MVHRAPDSRLLTNLIDHEKEYAKHLAALFPLSHAALASLSAYAAASPSPAHPIAAIVDVLATVDDALQRYAHAIDAWRQQLVGLKDLEDDLAAVLRDRDILVTRLIKASKSTRDTHRSSRLVAPLTSLGSASLSSLPSTNSTAGSSPASTNAKLAQAQAELQACEAHLLAKERELDARRSSVARDGLGARCRALIDCGWVWGEMGKQGLKALQALGTDGGHNLAVPTLTPRPSINPPTYASDNSSLTPSQSASQTATRSVETSHEGSAAKVHPPEPEPEIETARPSFASDGDLTLTLPPAHAISDLTFPTGIRTPPRSLENGESTATASPTQAPAPALKRKRTKRPRRPPSQHIPEASDEVSDEPTSASHASAKPKPTANANGDSRPFPTTTTTATHDTSSSDDHHPGPLHIVENDPFEVIRRSMLGPAVPPTARASAPDVRMSIIGDLPSPSKAVAVFPGSASTSGHTQGASAGMGAGSPPGGGKRQRKPSMAFFGSLRGLFRKPRARVGAWDEGHSSPSPASASPTKTGGRGSGWVTRTDARVRAKGGVEESDDEGTPKGASVGIGMGRAPSGARLRKGRPTRENGPSQRTGVDGWITDSPVVAAGVGVDMDRDRAGARTRTRKGTVRRKKLSVADLRGSEQGHTDGECDGRGSVEASAAGSTSVVPAGPSAPHRRATTTARKQISEAPPVHRRSASLSLVDAHVTIVSAATATAASAAQGPSAVGSMSWRKPPPPIEAQPAPSPSQVPPRPPSPSPTHASSQAQASRPNDPKHAARRHLGNGHAKHVQNQSLMSIVADVARLNQDWARERERGTRSLDVPRGEEKDTAREKDKEKEKDRGHGRGTGSLDGGSTQAPRPIKVPLRSALRNASRTPSPTPAPAPQHGPEHRRPEGRDAISPALRDSASISSYETGRESLSGESPPPSPAVLPSTSTSKPRPQSQPPPVGHPQMSVARVRSGTPPPPAPPPPSSPPLLFTFPPPPVEPPPARVVSATHGNRNGHGREDERVVGPPSSSTASTETPPARRKSVRVSLQPTFSPTPPASATYDEEAEAEADTPRHGQGRAAPRTTQHRGDVWADSSDEDEVYSRAKRLLSLVGRGRG